MSIPPILFRTVPMITTDQVEKWWQRAAELHPEWELRTYRDPIPTELFPLTSPHWARCESGAQLAGLVRLEALYHHGGIYIDSDVELYRPLGPLLQVSAFAAYQDSKWIPDAVLGFESHHPAVGSMIHAAIERIPLGTLTSGALITTEFLRDRDDILILPPGSFYPYHWRARTRFDLRKPDGRRRRAALARTQPWAFGAHHWAGSWV